jgi:hypothetical protein
MAAAERYYTALEHAVAGRLYASWPGSGRIIWSVAVTSDEVFELVRADLVKPWQVPTQMGRDPQTCYEATALGRRLAQQDAGTAPAGPHGDLIYLRRPR